MSDLAAPIAVFHHLIEDGCTASSWLTVPVGEPLVLSLGWAMSRVPVRLRIGNGSRWFVDERLAGGEHQLTLVAESERVCVWIAPLEASVAPVSIHGAVQAPPDDSQLLAA